MDKPNKKEFTPINWNAGGQFNDFVIACKYQVLEAQANKNYRLVLDTLHMDLASTRSKILREANKFEQEEKAKAMVDKLKIKLNNGFRQLTKELNQNTLLMLENNIRFITENLFEMQGDYGLLYPFEETTDNTDIPTSYTNQR